MGEEEADEEEGAARWGEGALLETEAEAEPEAEGEGEGEGDACGLEVDCTVREAVEEVSW